MRTQRQYSIREILDSISHTTIQNTLCVLFCFLAMVPLLYAISTPFSASMWIRATLHNCRFLVLTTGNLCMVVGIAAFCRKSHGHIRICWSWVWQNGLCIGLMLLLLWAFLSALFSKGGTNVWLGTDINPEGFFAYFAYAGIFLAGTQLQAFRIRVCVSFFVAGAAVIAFLSCFPETIPAFWGIDASRGIFTNANHYGYYLCMAIPALFYLICTEKKKIWYGIRALQLILLGRSLGYARSMGPLLAVALSLLCLLILLAVLKNQRLLVVALSVIVLVSSFCCLHSPKWDVWGDFRLIIANGKVLSESVAGKDVDSVEIEEAGSGRIKIWKVMFRLATEKPIFGWGPDQSMLEAEKQFEVAARPHNEYLQFAAELGFPALCFYVFAVSGHIWRCLRKVRNLGPGEIALLCLLISYLFSAFFGNTKIYTSPYFYLFLAFSYSATKQISLDKKAA